MNGTRVSGEQCTLTDSTNRPRRLFSIAITWNFVSNSANQPFFLHQHMLTGHMTSTLAGLPIRAAPCYCIILLLHHPKKIFLPHARARICIKRVHAHCAAPVGAARYGGTQWGRGLGTRSFHSNGGHYLEREPRVVLAWQVLEKGLARQTSVVWLLIFTPSLRLATVLGRISGTLSPQKALTRVLRPARG